MRLTDCGNDLGIQCKFGSPNYNPTLCSLRRVAAGDSAATGDASAGMRYGSDGRMLEGESYFESLLPTVFWSLNFVNSSNNILQQPKFVLLGNNLR
ncbi:hypothetical protein L6164_031580 [Bauhinia variegata]|uniref:Uncharacterized protein n=1 Tax=Bauhinia variegata TaxID=167791 RepID=A0ACB9LGD5_BAUVA|nr:hypothetical protein L6164_031580 [Bauhinia variegata]